MRPMKPASKSIDNFPPVPEDVFYAFRFTKLGFDLHIVPHNAKAAAAIRRKAKQKKERFAEYLAGELMFGLVLTNLKETE